MRIKFLSFIASFFMVSLFITSCLDNDESVEYSPDATIRAFALDTIGGYGVNYKFTIDQISGLIYNEDSLPVHADTIIDRILIKTLTTASGIVTMKSKSNEDSIINIADSMDLRKYVNTPKENKPLELTVWAPDMLTKKTYSVSIRMHHHDPDSLTWQHAGKIDDLLTESQKSITFKKNIYTYTIIGNVLKVYQSPISNMSWSSSTVTTTDGSITTMPTSILSYKDKLYATFKDKANAYVSGDGINWTKSPLENVELFLAPLKEKISYLKLVGDKHIFSTSANGETEDYSAYDKHKKYLEGDARLYLPNEVTAYTIYENRNGSEAAMLIGAATKSTTINDGEKEVPAATPWGYAEQILSVNELDAQGEEVLVDGQNKKTNITVSSWVAVPAGSSLAYCPELKNPIIIHYNSLFYLFGEGFETFYTSLSGRDWKKADKKFSFPYQDWTVSGFVPSVTKPEFRGRKKFSAVQDTEKGYIYVLFGKETGVTFTEEVKKGETTDRGPYNHDSEVWRGRLNQLWFDLVNSPK